MKRKCYNCAAINVVSYGDYNFCETKLQPIDERFAEGEKWHCESWEPDGDTELIILRKEIKKLCNQLEVAEKERDKLREQRNRFEADGIRKDGVIRKLRETLQFYTNESNNEVH